MEGWPYEEAFNMAEVKLYSTSNCPYCRMAKDYLAAEGAAFTVVDVSEDEKASQEMVAKSGQIGVPQLEVGDVLIVGFDRGAYRKALLDAGVLREAAE